MSTNVPVLSASGIPRDLLTGRSSILISLPGLSGINQDSERRAGALSWATLPLYQSAASDPWHSSVRSYN
jgi:hypothetical protein